MAKAPPLLARKHPTCGGRVGRQIVPAAPALPVVLIHDHRRALWRHTVPGPEERGGHAGVRLGLEDVDDVRRPGQRARGEAGRYGEVLHPRHTRAERDIGEVYAVLLPGPARLLRRVPGRHHDLYRVPPGGHDARQRERPIPDGGPGLQAERPDHRHAQGVLRHALSPVRMSPCGATSHSQRRTSPPA